MKRTRKSALLPFHRKQSVPVTINSRIRRFKRKYTILKVKWFLLFVLPILLIAVSYQTVKQFLKLKMRRVSGIVSAPQETSDQEPGASHDTHTPQRNTGKSTFQETI